MYATRFFISEMVRSSKQQRKQIFLSLNVISFSTTFETGFKASIGNKKACRFENAAGLKNLSNINR
jgi:hypothetical protein